MIKKRPRTARLVFSSLCFCLGVVGHVAGLQEDGESPVDTSPTGAVTVYRIPIEGTIDLGLAPFVDRIVAEAESQENAVVLLDIDTFGGRVDAAVLIRDSLLQSEVRSIAFIHPRAISAGALISLACTDIVMAPGGSIGAATPITVSGEEVTAADEKFLSYMRTEMRTTAETRGRRGDVAEAMVDREVEIEGVVEKGKVLTLTTEAALELEIADFEAGTLSAALEAVALADATVEDRAMNWAEHVTRWVSSQIVTSILFLMAFLGLWVEFQHPGLGLPGLVAVLALSAFFFGHHVAKLAGWEELALFAVGVILLMLELFVIPGFGVAGISGIVLILGSLVMSLLALDLKVSWDLGLVNRALMTVSTSIVIAAIGAIAMMKFLPATGVTRRLVLNESLATGAGFSSHDETEKEQFPLGTAGETITDLRPAGKIRIESQRIDAVSEGDFIATGTKVKVIAWRSGNAVVREDA